MLIKKKTCICDSRALARNLGERRLMTNWEKIYGLNQIGLETQKMHYFLTIKTVYTELNY